MTEEEKKEYEELKSLLYTGQISQYGKRKLIGIIENQDTEINKLKKEKEYYKKLYNESYNFLDPKFTGNHIPRID